VEESGDLLNLSERGSVLPLEHNRNVPELLSGLQVASWWKSPSGLLLPCSLEPAELGPQGSVPRSQALLVAQKPDPLPGYVAYATLESMGIEPLGWNQLQERLSKLPLTVVLPVLSDLQARLWSLGMDAEKHLALAETVLGSNHRLLKHLRNFVCGSEGRRVIFCEQAFLLLQWLSLAYCTEDTEKPPDMQEVAWLQQCLLSIPSYLDVVAKQEHRPKGPERWLPHLTQNLAFNAQPAIGNAMARTWKIFGQLYRESAPPEDAPLDDWFRRDYGLDLEQQLTLSFAVHAHLSTGEDEADRYGTVLKRSTLEDIYDRMDLDEDERAAADHLLSAPVAWFQGQLNDKTVEQLSWDQVPFMQHPFIRLNRDAYLLQCPRALQSWMIEGPYYRGLDSASARGPSAVRSYTQYVGELTERYVVDLVRSVHPEPRFPSTGKVYGDKQYGNGAHSSDVTISYPHEAVLMEVASHRLTVEAKRDGDPIAIRRDLNEMIGRRPRQLSRCINAIKPLDPARQATLRFEDLNPDGVARFWPIVITSMPIRWTGALEEFLNLGDSLDRADVEPLELMAIEDLEAILGLSERSGRTVSNLLARKAAFMGSHGDVRWWLHTDRSLPEVARPRYLEEALTEVLDLTTEMLGFDVSAIRMEEEEAA
jgi:hypothetical protein